MMPRTMSVAEAQSQFDTLVGGVARQREEIIVERAGESAVVLLSLASDEELQRLREQQRADLPEQFRELGKRLGASNQDLTEDQAIALADEIAHEIVDDMAARGSAVFERGLR